MLRCYKHQFHVPKVVSIGQSSLDELQGIPLSLAYVTIIICKQGYAIFNINFKNYIVRKNDIVILYDDTFAILQQKSQHFLVDYLLLDKNFSTDIAFQLPNFLFAFFNKQPVIKILNNKIEMLSQWQNLMMYIVKEKKEYWLLQLRNHMQNLFLEIANNTKQLDVKQHEGYSRKTQLCWRFWDLITQHSKVHRDVQFYAEKLSITPFYLSQITQNFFKDSPKVLIDRQVILEIKALLEIETLSIKEIAARLNFEDTSYLCRYFKRHTGITLSGFKKQRR